MKDVLELFIRVYEISPIPLRMAYGIWCAFIGLYIYASYHDHYNSPIRPRRPVQHNSPNVLVVLGLATVFLYTIAHLKQWPIHYSLIGDEAISFVGLPLMLIGLFVVAAARAALNGYWGPHIYEYEDPKDSILIKKGIYGQLRHPIYLGQIFMAVGTLILSDSIIFLLFAVPLSLFNVVKAQRESRYLHRKFGDSFVEYKNTVAWFCPGLF
ncbi:isoprenylcysteine carboxylmethyltransferase family protein [Uliginosibacterium sediminicola]|uniref:Isoprenylcysteine carboxylmethyltransferase family protein n=1 Tax=Uliginosibacterium sediminicola TaxID=2024550 RepID=A0ABU9YYZ4_9RHOO